MYDWLAGWLTNWNSDCLESYWLASLLLVDLLTGQLIGCHTDLLANKLAGYKYSLLSGRLIGWLVGKLTGLQASLLVC